MLRGKEDLIERLKAVADYELVHDEKGFIAAMNNLSREGSVALDAEGVELGRSGKLTVLSIGGLEMSSPIYIIDVLHLGGDRVFSDAGPSLKKLLECEETPKVMFDCRGDSDALLHQFGVKLSGVHDLQVFDQAIRVFGGESLPARCPYVTKGNVPFLSGMNTVAERVVGLPQLRNVIIDPPHRLDAQIWAKRPFDPKTIAYAASDIYTIKMIHKKFMEKVRKDTCALDSRRIKFWECLELASREQSKRYEGMFRDCKNEVKRSVSTENEFIMEERPMISEADLPHGHPNTPSPKMLQGRAKWETTVKKLKTEDMNANSLFSNVIFILQHDLWYTDYALEYLRELASEYPYFTQKQRAKIRDPPKLRSWDDSDSDEYESYQSEYQWMTYGDY